MATFLLKTEPDDYSWDDLVAEKRTSWDGVTSPAAQMHMRAMSKGDEAFIYHTGNERRIVGLARVVRGGYADPAKPGTTAAGETKFSLIDVSPLRAASTPDATLAAVKADERFAGFALVREGRLGVMPVPPKLDRLLRKMAGL